MDKLVEKFLKSKNYLDTGAGKLSRLWRVTKEEVYAAKLKAREIIAASKEAELNNIISEQEEQIATYLGSKISEDSIIKKFESPVPLSPKEIEELVKVDNVTTKITRIWDKLLANGKWTYAVDIKFADKSFYNKEQLEEKLKEIFPAVTPVKIPPIYNYSEKALVVCISDDHAGAVNMIADKWTPEEYKSRLLHLVSVIKNLPYRFEEVHILSLGDQLNGWNSQTTRGGHEVKSLSNRDQFDMYTSGRVSFYDDLFTSGIGNSYHIHEVENSNHSGKDFSYMANKFLEMYIKQKYPSVIFNSYKTVINNISYGKHDIVFTHGKDENLMTKNMPLRLDLKTDLYLYQYLDKRGISPSKSNVTLYKGDLHNFSVDKGKFGRYVNIPSLMGSTDWTQVNFGETCAGAVLEILERDTSQTITIPVWFKGS